MNRVSQPQVIPLPPTAHMSAAHVPPPVPGSVPPPVPGPDAAAPSPSPEAHAASDDSRNTASDRRVHLKTRFERKPTSSGFVVGGRGGVESDALPLRRPAPGKTGRSLLPIPTGFTLRVGPGWPL